MSESFESLLKFMRIEADKENHWDQTVSGKLYGHLKVIAVRENKDFGIEGKGGPVEIMRLGDETATVIKHLENSTVGLEGGNIKTFVEAWDYKRLGWWKEVLDKEQMPVSLLDTPVLRAAKDAGVSECETIFRPSVVIKKFDLLKSSDWRKEDEIVEWIRSQTTKLLAPKLMPDYAINFSDGGLRLRPLTQEAKQSLIEDNDTYRRALDSIREIAPILEEEWRKKAESIKETEG